jgi:hypothetical protein
MWATGPTRRSPKKVEFAIPEASSEPPSTPLDSANDYSEGNSATAQQAPVNPPAPSPCPPNADVEGHSSPSAPDPATLPAREANDSLGDPLPPPATEVVEMDIDQDMGDAPTQDEEAKTNAHSSFVPDQNPFSFQPSSQPRRPLRRHPRLQAATPAATSSSILPPQNTFAFEYSLPEQSQATHPIPIDPALLQENDGAENGHQKQQEPVTARQAAEAQTIQLPPLNVVTDYDYDSSLDSDLSSDDDEDYLTPERAAARRFQEEAERRSDELWTNPPWRRDPTVGDTDTEEDEKYDETEEEGEEEEDVEDDEDEEMDGDEEDKEMGGDEDEEMDQDGADDEMSDADWEDVPGASRGAVELLAPIQALAFREEARQAREDAQMRY